MVKVIQDPTYTESPVDIYRGNPLIEALPHIFDPSEVIGNFMNYPSRDEKEMELPAHIRYHYIKKLKDYTQPLAIHIDLEMHLSSIIRRGYLARNPLAKEFNQRVQLVCDMIEDGDKEDLGLWPNFDALPSTADSISIIGISGIGKTTAIDKLLRMYPQVIIHKEYQGKLLNHKQIVWLKMDCSYDGSIKTLCQSFFKAIDDVLGSDYFRKFGNPRNTKGFMMIHMERLAALHSIGVIVIDEMQHLIHPKNNPDEMLNFLVTLENLISVPLILIGTYKALKVLSKDLRQARRASSEKCFYWDRMIPSTKEGDWEIFLETMWDYQWLKHFTPYNEKFSKVIYEESQGITAIAKNLFILAQERALRDGSEKLTVKLIKETAKKDLLLVKDIIRALRKNDYKALARYDDIRIRYEDINAANSNSATLSGRIAEIADSEKMIRENKRKNLLQDLIQELYIIGIFEDLSEKVVEEICQKAVETLGVAEDYSKIKVLAIKFALEAKENKEENKEEKNEELKIKLGEEQLENQDLRKLLKRAIKQQKHVYDLLVTSNYICDPVKEFHKVG